MPEDVSEGLIYIVIKNHVEAIEHEKKDAARKVRERRRDDIRHNGIPSDLRRGKED